MKSIGNLVLGVTIISAISVVFSGCGGTIAALGQNKYSIHGEVEDEDDRSDLHDDAESYCEDKNLHSMIIRERKTSKDYMIIDFRCITEAHYKKAPVPKHIKRALKKKGLMKTYLKRPTQQQSNYIGWIEEAGKGKEQEKRLNEMLDELKVGDVYTETRSSQSAEATNSNIMPKR